MRSSDGAVSAYIRAHAVSADRHRRQSDARHSGSIDNREGQWTPGLRVIATVRLPPQSVPLGVRTAGLQNFCDFTVVFAQVGTTYEVRMLELGRTDGEMIEVLGGLDVR